MYGGIIFLIALLIFIYRSFVGKKRDNEIIDRQKKIVEQQQKEVLDSIHYAKRIQEALMPTARSIEKIINELKNKKWNFKRS